MGVRLQYSRRENKQNTPRVTRKPALGGRAVGPSPRFPPDLSLAPGFQAHRNCNLAPTQSEPHTTSTMGRSEGDNVSPKDRVLSPRHIEGLIAAGQSIVIIDRRVLRIDAFIPYHPGGHKPIQHLIGKDASDEVMVFHSEEIRKQMFRYQIGRIEGRWRNFVPPIQGGRFRASVEEKEKETDEQQQQQHIYSDEKLHSTNHSGIEQDDGRLDPISPAVTELNTKEEQAFLDSETKKEISLTLTRYPPLDEATQGEIIEKYRRLYDQIQAEGLYDCNYMAYAREFGRCALIFGVMLFFLHIEWYCTSAVFLGFFWSQLVFSAHDAGHMAITHNFTIDNLIGMTIAAPIGGLSLGWWKRTHNVHHIVTNAPEHDPDNQHLPFFAVNHRFMGNIISTYHERLLPYDKIAKFLVPYQAYLYYPILALGRFNLYVQSWIFLIQGQGPRKGIAWWHRWFEIVGNVIFWIWFGYGLVYRSIPSAWSRFLFVMISHMVTMPLHVQFTVSHFAMSTMDLGPHESFAQRMLRTTMDVDCPEWLDFIHGGLQFQAIHHLYPRVPRHNLRRTQKLVLEFCRDVGIPYALYGFVGGNKKVVGSLAEVSRQAAILAKCQQTIAERGDLLHGR
ncbi:fatty acid/sphingolipid desaturase [Aspergillus heteromorphus CBS 117.55]|uniref:Delta 8-(E)-sphingolipid desaturase n=1 Tax=Aspergillus heteromorphus CBS 117.55 TaxID=1448321 RepID=A0A317UUR4_9EURO|nr:fatty acid/sphingolipid desaturase [Aspergillus heteromorphus CBS 117.55]PWY64252.1 fatty acid/sphingolipid desaturase [Aspergillus heteromorphus CBS 117.55]